MVTTAERIGIKQGIRLGIEQGRFEGEVLNCHQESWMYQQDWIKRVIEQLAGLVAQVMALKEKGELQVAQDRIDDGYALLGMDASYLRLDGQTLAMLLGAERAQAARRLSELEADIAEARGDEARARWLRCRARDLG